MMQSSTANFDEKSFSLCRSNRMPIFKIQRTVKNSTIEENYEEVSTSSSYGEDTKSIERDRRFLPQSRKITKEKVQKEERIRRGPRSCWSQAEDKRVLELFKKYGPKWSKIAKLLDNRKPKQVRDRYVNILNPEIDHSPWTPEEDKLFNQLYKRFGKKWCKIAEHMPRRSENQAKNRFYWHLNKGRLLKKHNAKCSKNHVLRSCTCQKNTGKDQSQNSDSTSDSEFNEFVIYLESESDFQESGLDLEDQNTLETDQKEDSENHFLNIPDQPDSSVSISAKKSQELHERDHNIEDYFQSHLEEMVFQMDPFSGLTFDEIIFMKSQTLSNPSNFGLSERTQETDFYNINSSRFSFPSE